jgi:hypothetical protein
MIRMALQEIRGDLASVRSQAHFIKCRCQFASNHILVRILLQEVAEDLDGGFRLVIANSKCSLQVRQDFSAAEFQLLATATRAH